MPTYDIRCERCGHETEIELRITDPLPPCARCGAPVKRLISSAGRFVLRGTGWASDGYTKAGGR